MKETFLSWGMLVLSVLFNVFGVFVIKMRLNILGPVGFDSFKNVLNYFWLLLKSPLVVAGVMFFSLSPFLFTVALSRMEISLAYPVNVGLNFVLLVLLAFLVLGEQITMLKGAGIILVFAGIFLLNK
ncbi:MAG: hypothetical protein KAR05_09255 [Candidatus Omnitrophica bacterium]|nr:hypothetical protein [Candidatus Omnitrophota bacterium]